MNAKQMLQAAGFPDTKKGRADFYKQYPSLEIFLMKFGGQSPAGFYELGGGNDPWLTSRNPNFLDKNQNFYPTYEGNPNFITKALGGEPCFECDEQYMQDGGENWMQKASSSMKAKGTVGSFTDYCGGKVTDECIQRGLNSPDETTRKRAAFAKAARSIKKEMGGEADTSSTDNFLAQQNDYFKNALNFNSLNSMVNTNQEGDLFKADWGVGVGAGYRLPDAGGPNAPQDEDHSYSDGYDPRNDERYRQNYNPNYYTQTPVPYGYGYNPYGGWFGGMMGRIQPRNKITINYNGVPAGSSNSGSSSGSGSGAPTAQGKDFSGTNPFAKGEMEIIKSGLLHRLAPKRFAPKHYKVTWGDENQTAPANAGIANAGTSSNNAAKSPGFTAGFPAVYGPQMKPTTAPYQPKFMGPDMDVQDTTLPQMNFQTPADPYVPESNYSPFTTFAQAPIGPMQSSGQFKKGGSPMYAGGGSFESKRSWGFDMSNLNPDNIIAGEQAIANFLERGQNQRILDEQMARNMDVMNFSPTNTEFDRGFNMFDPTIMQNPEKTGVMVTSAGQSNWDGQRQFGGQINEGDEVEMSDEELQEFFRNGGTVEFLE